MMNRDTLMRMLAMELLEEMPVGTSYHEEKFSTFDGDEVKIEIKVVKKIKTHYQIERMKKNDKR